MYIQIDERLRNELEVSVFATGLMGSHCHGLNDEQSDTDYIKLFYDPNYADTIHWDSYGFQYKTATSDENYQEIRSYIRNLIIGDSPADYEALMYGFVSDSDDWKVIESWLKLNIKSYSLMKSYLGYIKKDIKDARKIITSTSKCRALFNKMSHISRGISTVINLIHDRPYAFGTNTDSFEFKEAKSFKDGTNDEYESSAFIADLLKSDEVLVESIRTNINMKLESNLIVRRMHPSKLKELDVLLAQFLSCYSISYPINYGDIRYQVIEKGLTFQYDQVEAIT